MAIYLNSDNTYKALLSTVKSLLSIAVSTMYVRIHKFTGMVFDFTERKKLKMKKSLDVIITQEE